MRGSHGGGKADRLRCLPGLARHGMVKPVLLTIAVIAPAATVLDVIRDPARAAAQRAHPARPPSDQATVAIVARGQALTVPRSFLGLSVEYPGLTHFASYAAQFERALLLVQAPGEGPVLLRIGGDSADRTFGSPEKGRGPLFGYYLTGSWWRSLGSIVRRTGARVIIDMNLVTGRPHMIAGWAHKAETVLPEGSIAGFEVGNEPDEYTRSSYVKSIALGRIDPALVPLNLSPMSYLVRFDSYAAVLSKVAPNVPLIAPALGKPNHRRWITTLLAAPHPGLETLSVHSYPYSQCATQSSPKYPTIARLLSENASAGVAGRVAADAQLARAAGLALRLTELNSVNCGGRPGVSDTFATALWAPDTLFELMREGVEGANIHVRSNAINTPFYVGRGGLRAQPLLYGLALFARTLGPGAELLHTDEQASRSVHVKAWAVRVRGGLVHVLLINKGPNAAHVNLPISATGPVTVQRLLAVSVRSRWDVTLAGQSINANGRWSGRRMTSTAPRTRRGHDVALPPYSAALVSMQLRPRAGRATRGV